MTDPTSRPKTPARPIFRRIINTIGGFGHGRQHERSRNVVHALEACRALLSERGEVLGVKLATDAVTAFQRFGTPEREAFLDVIAAEFSVDPAKILAAAEAYKSEPSAANLARLQGAAASPRQELFRRFNAASSGTRLLVEMRHAVGVSLAEHPSWVVIDDDLLHLLKSWFSRGFLELRRIDWRTPAIVLERLIQYEAVHAIQGWRDLRRRLATDRRCYGFFHPGLPDEPLIFVEVALTRGISATVQPLLDPDSAVVDPAKTNCAIFYSITNCQPGLRGVAFGHHLIKQVVEDLGREFPRLHTFATISPIPGFRTWLTANATESLMSRELASWIAASDGATAVTLQNLEDRLRTEIVRLCAYYLFHAKSGRVPIDSVERFHLANGARVERLNWLGDISATGIQRSLGMTVNYLYRLEALVANHDVYVRRHDVVASARFMRLLK